MKKKRILLYALSLVVICTAAYMGRNYKTRLDTLKEWEGYKTVSYRVYNTEYELLVADTVARQEKGLMYVRELKGFDGMIFLFPEEEIQTFWNKNTFRDLDVYWIRKGKVIGKERLPSIEKGGEVVISSPEPVDTVIEIIRPF